MTKNVQVENDIRFSVDVEDYVLVMDAFGRIRNKTPLQVRNAINTTQKELVKFLAKQTNRKYIAKQSEIKGSIKSTKATTTKLEAVIKSTSPMTEMYGRKISDRELHWPFNSSPRPTRIKGKVLREESLKKLELRPGAKDAYKAFVARFQNKHVTVVQRVPGKRMKSKPWKEALKKLLAPADPMMVGKVYDEETPEVSKILEKHIQDNLDRIITM